MARWVGTCREERERRDEAIRKLGEKMAIIVVNMVEANERFKV